MAKMRTIQEDFFNRLCSNQISIAIYLKNGVRLTGYIDRFDQYTIILKANNNDREDLHQLVYKHAIATVVPFFDNNNRDRENNRER